MKTIVLDLAYENSIDDIYQSFENTNISMIVLNEEGPAGGWPECELTGTEENLREWLLANYCDKEDIDYILNGE
jgi:hypothetical protein